MKFYTIMPGRVVTASFVSERVRSDDSIVVLNVKEEARVGQKNLWRRLTVHASISSIDSIDDDGLTCC